MRLEKRLSLSIKTVESDKIFHRGSSAFERVECDTLCYSSSSCNLEDGGGDLYGCNGVATCRNRYRRSRERILQGWEDTDL